MKIVLALLVLLWSACPVFAQQGESRVALVIGNSNYVQGPLRNPINDARDMSARLRELGFVVVERTDLRIRQIGSTLREFRGRLTPGSVALVFYAGHGLQIRGENYLPAVDAQIEGEEDVPNQSLAVRQIMDVLAEAGTRLNLVFLDSCRDNRFQRSFRSAVQGLARESVPSGTLLSFATRPGGLADDGPGRNGRYTGALLEAMRRVDQPIERVLKDVATAVRQATRNQQEPWIEGSIQGEFCFGTCAEAIAAPPTPPDREDRFWDSAQKIGNREAYEAYLKQYPSGQYAPLARAAIARLAQAVQAAPVKPVPPPAPVASPTAPPPPPARVGLGAPGTVFKDCDACPEMVVIPAGRFQMGAAPGEEESEDLPEQFRNWSQPRRWVEVRGFAAGRFEVTRGLYRVFAEETGRTASGCWVWNGKEWAEDAGKSWRDPGYVQDDGHPVTCVNWEDAKAYTEWLSRRTGKGYRLLSEAEWEYAARAGTTTRRYWGDDGNQSCGFANGLDFSARSQVPGMSNFMVAQCDDGYAWTAPVGRYRPNAFGLYDMLGNVFEWVEDCWKENYAGAPADGRAWTSGECGRRVVRGGSWYGFPANLRAAFRSRLTTSIRNFSLGFRVARTD